MSWGALLAPAGTPKPVVERIAGELRQILADKDVQERMLNAGAIARYQSPTELAQRLQQDYQRWGQIIRDKGISQD